MTKAKLVTTRENFFKQWKVAEAEYARLEATFFANFTLKYPGVKVLRVHDSWCFDSLEDYQLFTSEFEKFRKEQNK